MLEALAGKEGRLDMQCRLTRPCAGFPAILALVFITCCGNDGDVDEATKVPDIGGGLELPIFNGEDSATEDMGDLVPTDVVTADITAGSCPGGPSCPCTENGDCDAALCMETAEGNKCAADCVENCPTGFTCAQVPSGSDITTVCVSSWARLCSPCEENKQCQYPGIDGARCVSHGATGAFCGAPCVDDDHCPATHTCKAVADLDGKTSKQCIPTPDAGSEAEFGACTCNANTTALSFKAACTKQLITEGDTITCAGTRMCSSDGALQPCETVEPGLEKCDGLDNDCNGKTDDGACDDDNGCTTDSCDPTKGCGHTDAADGLPCDADSTVCTENDACSAGKCQGGKIKVCDDKNPCTQDTCLPASGCTQTVDDGVPCDDENPCTVGDVCGDGTCNAGKPKKCESGQPCVDAVCDLADGGKCAFSDKKNGTACDDGDKCTGPDTCDSGKCDSKEVSCDDDNVCTTDSCGPGAGCQHKPTAGGCSDNNSCTVGDACDGGGCKAGSLKDCGDKNPCTVDACAKDSGACENVAMPLNGTSCDADGSKCTVDDACDGGKCIAGKLIQCDDGNTCTDDACDAATGKCNSKPAAKAGTVCNADSSVCTKDDKCDVGKCVAGPLTLCDDGNACTTDSCSVADGCAHAANTASCDDGDGCSVGDVCKGKGCSAGKQKACDDGQVCTIDGCDAKSGECLFDAKPLEAKPCDADGTACTAADKCVAGKCAAGKAVVCDDGNACTVDTCDAKTGKCGMDVAAMEAKACNADDDGCTVGDACKAGGCVVGAKATCNLPAGACQANSCVTVSATEHKCVVEAKADVTPCDDANGCTVADFCKGGMCLPGSPKTCDDNNPCTADLCDKTTGDCGHSPSSGNEAVFCGNSGGVCIAGACSPSQPTIAVAAQHSCAVHSPSRVVRCWGAGSKGQLGDLPVKGDNPSMTQVQGMGAVLSIALGLQHSCAVLVSGQVACWGDDEFGQLGDGVAGGKYSGKAKIAGGVSGARSIAVGTGHTCAATHSGSVYCWGDNQWYQLGDGTKVGTSTAKVVKLPEPIVRLDSANYSTCGLSKSGGVFCWGYNGQAQLGTGSAAVTPLLVKVQGIPPMRDIAVSGTVACGIGAKGGLYCWGSNFNGVLDLSSKKGVLPPTKMGVASPVIQASVVGSYGCALRPDGKAVCWGNSSGSGVLGEGEFGLPALSVLPPTESFGDAVEFAATSGHVCARRADGTVSCRGSNTQGQLGEFFHSTLPKPFRVPCISDVKHASRGLGHACAVVSGGGIRCWGADGQGQVGDGKGPRKQLPPVAPKSAPSATMVAVGDEHSCALSVAGTVTCWGGNTYGQLGTGSKAPHDHPVPVVPQLSNVAQVAAAPRHTCAVDSKGKAYCWGSGVSGQLGNGSKVVSLQPALVKNAPQFKKVAPGESHTCALASSGAVYCWGYPNFVPGSKPGDDTTMPVLVKGLPPAVQLSSGRNHVCAISNSGTVHCWGMNGNLQAGSTSNGSASWAKQPAQVAGISGAKSIGLAAFSSCALDVAGSVFCWGFLDSGILGVSPSSNGNSAVAKKVVGLPKVAALVNGGYHAHSALTPGGQLWSWGANPNASAGLGFNIRFEFCPDVAGVTGVK